MNRANLFEQPSPSSASSSTAALGNRSSSPSSSSQNKQQPTATATTSGASSPTTGRPPLAPPSGSGSTTTAPAGFGAPTSVLGGNSTNSNISDPKNSNVSNTDDSSSNKINTNPSSSSSTTIPSATSTSNIVPGNTGRSSSIQQQQQQPSNTLQQQQQQDSNNNNINSNITGLNSSNNPTSSATTPFPQAQNQTQFQPNSSNINNNPQNMSNMNNPSNMNINPNMNMNNPASSSAPLGQSAASVLPPELLPTFFDASPDTAQSDKVLWYGNVDKVGRGLGAHNRAAFITSSAIILALPTGGVTRVIPLESASNISLIPPNVIKIEEPGKHDLVLCCSDDNQRDQMAIAVKNAHKAKHPLLPPIQVQAEQTLVLDSSTSGIPSAAAVAQVPNANTNPSNQSVNNLLSNFKKDPSPPSNINNNNPTFDEFSPDRVAGGGSPQQQQQQQNLNRNPSNPVSAASMFPHLMGSNNPQNLLQSNPSSQNNSPSSQQQNRAPSVSGSAIPSAGNPQQQQNASNQNLLGLPTLNFTPGLESSSAMQPFHQQQQQNMPQQNLQQQIPPAGASSAPNYRAPPFSSQNPQEVPLETAMAFPTAASSYDGTDNNPQQQNINQQNLPQQQQGLELGHLYPPSSQHINPTTGGVVNEITPPQPHQQNYQQQNSSSILPSLPSHHPLSAQPHQQQQHLGDTPSFSPASPVPGTSRQLEVAANAVTQAENNRQFEKLDQLANQVASQAQVIEVMRQKNEHEQLTQVKGDLSHANNLISDLQAALKSQEATFAEMLRSQEALQISERARSEKDRELTLLRAEREAMQRSIREKEQQMMDMREAMTRVETKSHFELERVRQAFVDYDKNVGEYVERQRLQHFEDMEGARRKIVELQELNYQRGSSSQNQIQNQNNDKSNQSQTQTPRNAAAKSDSSSSYPKRPSALADVLSSSSAQHQHRDPTSKNVSSSSQNPNISSNYPHPAVSQAASAMKDGRVDPDQLRSALLQIAGVDSSSNKNNTSNNRRTTLNEPPSMIHMTSPAAHNTSAGDNIIASPDSSHIAQQFRYPHHGNDNNISQSQLTGAANRLASNYPPHVVSSALQHLNDSNAAQARRDRSIL